MAILPEASSPSLCKAWPLRFTEPEANPNWPGQAAHPGSTKHAAGLREQREAAQAGEESTGPRSILTYTQRHTDTHGDPQRLQ